MKFFAITFALIPIAVLAQPTSPAQASSTTHPNYPQAVDEKGSIEKRTVGGQVLADGLHYRSCPQTACKAIGEYEASHPLELVCYTREATTVMNGDA